MCDAEARGIAQTGVDRAPAPVGRMIIEACILDKAARAALQSLHKGALGGTVQMHRVVVGWAGFSP